MEYRNIFVKYAGIFALTFFSHTPAQAVNIFMRMITLKILAGLRKKKAILMS